MESPKSKDPQKELEVALSELEERVDRLRASYEQYFMGYEKLEPGVQRKDVDRRFTVLRKQQIRNTALRFRFNVITQKFNTYSMYWTRVCRQIEEGTYKRHVAKAAKRFGNSTPNKREQDWSIEVELGDFEEVDMASVLAEADAAAEAYARGGLDADTIPPGALSEPPVAEPIARPAALPVKRSPMTLPTPGTSFAMSGGRETVGGDEPPSSEATPAPLRESAPRAVRHAPLPPGARQPVLVRRRADDAPPSTPDVARGDRRSSPLPTGEPHATRPPPASRPDLRPAAPSSDRAMPPSSSPIHTPAPSSAGRPAPGSNRVPAAPPSSEGAPPSVRRIAPAAAPPSTGRIPVAARSSAGNITTPASPMTPPRVAQPAPYRPAALPPSANRLPVTQTPPAAPRMPTPPTVRPPTPSAGRLPVPPGSTPQGPSPSGVDSEQPRPSRRPPPPLPGQPNKKA